MPASVNDPAETPAHLTPKTTDRGFDHYPAIPGAYGGEALVYESSAASAPHVWLNVTETPLHLTAENAIKLAEQLLAAVANHYQNEEPESAITLTRVVRTCSACPAQWDAWDAAGNYYYLRFRFGHGTVSFGEAGGPTIARFNKGDELDGVIDLELFAELAGLDASQAVIS